MKMGFQVSQLDVGYSRILVAGLNSFCSKNGIDLIVFPGRAPGWPYGGYEYQHSAIYEHITTGNLDCLVVASGTQCNYVSYESFCAEIQAYHPLPVVSLSIPLPGVPAVKIDNRQGLYDLLEHLYQVHSCRRFAVLKGPVGNEESSQRLRVFHDFLDDHDIARDPVLELQGDFTEQDIDLKLDRLLTEHGLCFDALLGLNDVMAIAAQRHLQALGYRIPADVCVAGFDGIEQGQLENPTLTTVYQPLEEQAWHAAGLAVRLAEGHDVQLEHIFPTRPVIRESCGCMSATVASMDPAVDLSQAHEASPLTIRLQQISERLGSDPSLDYRQAISLIGDELQSASEYTPAEKHHAISTAYRNTLAGPDQAGSRQLFDYCFQGARILLSERLLGKSGRHLQEVIHHIILLRENLAQLVSMVATEELADQLHEHLKRLDIRSCALVIFQEQISNRYRKHFALPEEAQLLLSYDQDWDFKHQQSRKLIFNPRTSMLPEGCFSPRTRTLLCSSLFHRDEQLGYIVYEPGELDPAIYETIVAQLASTIKTALIFSAKLQAEKRLRTAMSELEKYNRKLNKISMTDSLTGLYNRRGFLSIGNQSLDLAVRMGKSGMVVFCDLDSLKVINDNFGHDAGDRAIIAAAEIMHKTFRGLDVVARLGGDEFSALAVDLHPSFLEKLHSRLDEQTQSYNSTSNEPFLLSFSMGAASFTGDTTVALEQLLTKADSILYEEKRSKQDRSLHVIRPTST
ncbi:MAG: diguanylate cyclase [Spirochaeta sp.]